MKFLLIGNADFGNQDRETDFIYQVIALTLRTNAVHNGDPLEIILSDEDSYFNSVVEQIASSIGGLLEVYPLEAEYVDLELRGADYTPGDALSTELVLGDSGPVSDVFRTLDPEVDMIGVLTDDILGEVRPIVEEILAEGYSVSWGKSDYATHAIPLELYPGGQLPMPPKRKFDRPVRK
jgi:hypothetical protein